MLPAMPACQSLPESLQTAMNESESSEVIAADRYPGDEIAAASGMDQNKGGKGCLFAAGVGTFLLVFLALGLTAPSLVRIGKKGEQMIAMSSGKSMILALNDFASEYGSFPDRETAKLVRGNTHTTLDLDGDSANAYFRQLIAAGVAKSEDPFFSVTPYSLKRPDNRFTTNSEALRPGEVGYGYLMDGNKAMDTSDPNRFIAVTPLLDATATGEFDSQPLDGKAALLCVDSSVRLISIQPDTHQIRVSGRRTLLETGVGTIWGETIHPVIKPPLTPPGWKPGMSMPNYRPKKTWFWPISLLVGGLALALIAAWAKWRKVG